MNCSMANYIQNKKAHFNFDLQEEFEAGAELYGFEVKSIRHGKGSLDGAFVRIRGDEAFLVGATISPFQVANTPKDYDPERARRLLLNKKELAKLYRASEQSGLTIVPIKWYNKGGKIKLAIALARGKKKFDKRHSIKERDVSRDIARTLKQHI